MRELINQTLADLQRHTLYNQRAYRGLRRSVRSTPTVTDGTEIAFNLAPPSEVQTTPLASYVDRVILEADYTKEDIEEIANSMLRNMYNHEFCRTTEIVSTTFQIPGTDEYCRETDNGKFEIRLCVQGNKMERNQYFGGTIAQPVMRNENW